MIISVASGKGGTGKTTVATAIALSMGYCQLFDFDVEAPNAGFFIKPDIRHIQKVTIKQPVFLTDTGVSFSECAKFCHYNAIAAVGNDVIFFPGTLPRMWRLHTGRARGVSKRRRYLRRRDT